MKYTIIATIKPLTTPLIKPIALSSFSPKGTIFTALDIRCIINPNININNEKVNEFNTQIKDIFEKKAKSILNTQSGNIVYSVKYSAYISNNILSLVIRSTLKEGTNPQRDIVQTYNYDLINQKEYTIDDILQAKGITKKIANQKIKEEIKDAQQRSESLQKITGASTYTRDYTSDIYNINNVYIVDEAERANTPYNINHIKDIAIFIAIGLIVSVGYVLISNLLDTTVKSAEDIEKELGVVALASIPLLKDDTKK